MSVEVATSGGKRRSPVERFWSNVDRTDLFGCWNWNGIVDPGNGYGRPRVNGQKVYAHRFSYEYACGPIPDGLGVLHRCNNKRCINPAHLYAGTPKENAEDAKRDGVLGPNKLGADKAREIVRRRFEEKASYLELSKEFGVSAPTIVRICKGQHWSEATGIVPRHRGQG